MELRLPDPGSPGGALGGIWGEAGYGGVWAPGPAFLAPGPLKVPGKLATFRPPRILALWPFSWGFAKAAILPEFGFSGCLNF